MKFHTLSVVTKKSPAAVTDPINDKKNLVMFYDNFWDQFAAGERTFGWLVRVIYHEMTHVMQYQPDFKIPDESFTMSEFRSNAITVLDNRLPCLTQADTEYYVSTSLYFLTRDADRKKDQVEQNARTVQLLLYQCPAGVRKDYIKEFKLNNYSVKFY